jgi:hypothetical protein
MTADILFITSTHGDESIGTEVIRAIPNTTNTFSWIIGNEPALRQGVRFCDADLNRSAPGDKASPLYEKRRAAEIIALSQQYRYTIDIHGSIKNNGIFIIITNPSKENLYLASLFTIAKIVIWPSLSPEQQGPLSEYVPCGLEIECGPKTDRRVHKQLQLKLTDFLAHIHEREQTGVEYRLSKRSIYYMYDPLLRTECSTNMALEEFQETTVGNETFTPLFIGSYDYTNILAYKLRRITLEQALSLTL